eukprot:7148895-Pyramimonas_sp.AAC.1
MLDLWVLIWDAIDRRGPGQITVLWAKSHPTPEMQEKFAIGSDEFFLNWCADFFAGWAADA